MDALQVMDLLDAGVAANWNDPLRTGKLIELPARGDVMFTGDLHGAVENYSLILKKADLDKHPDRHLILHEVVHQLQLGQDQSFRLLEKVAALKARYPGRVHLVMGNHDLAEIQGREIFKGGICLNLLFANAVEKAYGVNKDRVREKYLDFLKTLPLAILAPNRIFLAHSTPEAAEVPKFSMDYFRASTIPEDFRPHSLMEKMIWGRDYSPRAADAFAELTKTDVFLVGHAPCAFGYNVPNHRHIILDSKDRFATYILFSLERDYSHEELKSMVRFFRPKVETAQSKT